MFQRLFGSEGDARKAGWTGIVTFLAGAVFAAVGDALTDDTPDTWQSLGKVAVTAVMTGLAGAFAAYRTENRAPADPAA